MICEWCEAAQDPNATVRVREGMTVCEGCHQTDVDDGCGELAVPVKALYVTNVTEHDSETW